MDALFALTTGGVVVVVLLGSIWSAWRRNARSWERIAGRIGLNVTSNGGAEGSIEGRKIILTRLPALRCTLSLELGSAWDKSLLASHDGCSRPLMKLFARYAAFESTVREVLKGNPDAEVRNGALVLHSQDWPETQAALEAWLNEGSRSAGRLDVAAREVVAAERDRLQRWKETLERMGLRIVDAEHIEGSVGNCELALTRTDAGARVRAPLGPDLPAAFAVWPKDAEKREANAERVDAGDLADLVVVESDQPERTRRLLEHQDMRSALRRLFETIPRAAISNAELNADIDVWDESIEALEQALGSISDVITQFQRHTDWPGKRPAATSASRP